MFSQATHKAILVNDKVTCLTPFCFLQTQEMCTQTDLLYHKATKQVVTILNTASNILAVTPIMIDYSENPDIVSVHLELSSEILKQ